MLVRPYCTYISRHTAGFFYVGKGRSQAVINGTYKGSGTAFKATLLHPAYGWDTWTTEVLECFDDEEAAYAAEAKLVTLDTLKDPFCLNEQVGGRSGRNQNRSLIVRRARAAEKRERALALRQKRALREAATKEKLKSLRSQLRKS